ncbi:MAG: hypothetical protein M3O87_03350, partial [Candidatus Dormibacteraeota bacterium]|nr:hypothetical protein [Candidatus Dormibacteraeota bacterium]
GQNCTWHLDQTDIQSPSLVLQYEVAKDASPQSTYLRSVIKQGLGTAVPDVGDVALIQGATGLTLDGVSGNTIFHVRVQIHDSSVDTKHQQELTTNAAKLIVARLPH